MACMVRLLVVGGVRARGWRALARACTHACMLHGCVVLAVVVGMGMDEGGWVRVGGWRWGARACE